MATIPQGGGGGGVATVDVTVEPLTYQVDPVSGTDPTEPVRFTTQAEIDAYGAFATFPAAIDTVPSALFHKVRIQLADGVHPIGVEGFGKINRFSSDYLEGDYDAWYPPKVFGALIIESKNGLVRVDGTSAMTLQAKTNNSTRGLYSSILTMTADPGYIDDTYKKFFLRTLTGSKAGELYPIFTHSGATFVTQTSCYVGAGDQFEIVECAAKLGLQYETTLSPVIVGGREGMPFIFNGVEFITLNNEWSDIYWISGDIWFVGGTRLLMNDGFYGIGGRVRLSNVITDNWFSVQSDAVFVFDGMDWDGGPWGFSEMNTAIFGGLRASSGYMDTYVSKGAGFVIAFAGIVTMIDASTAVYLQGPGRTTGGPFSYNCSNGASISNGMFMQARLNSVFATVGNDVYFDNQSFPTWNDLLYPAFGEYGSKIF